MGVVAAIVGFVGAFKQARAMKKAAAAQREQNNIQRAGDLYNNMIARRRAIRDARVRRAQILQGAEGAGVSGSSGELGAMSATQSNIGNEIAVQGSQVLAADGMSRAAQREADAISTAKRWGAIVDAFDSLSKLHNTWSNRV